MNLRDHRRTFSYSGRDPLIGTAAHVANGEHAFYVGLQLANRLIVMRNIASRQNETVVVQLHVTALEPRSIWVDPNEQKNCCTVIVPSMHQYLDSVRIPDGDFLRGRRVPCPCAK